MLIIAVILAVLFISGGVYLKHSVLGPAKQKHLLESPTKGMSRVAKQVYREYMDLPEDSRPFPDVVSILRGIDAKLSPYAEERDNHFNEKWLEYSEVHQGGMDFRWYKGAKCHHREDFQKHESRGYRGTETWYSGCRFKEYVDLHEGIMDIKRALKEKEIAVLEASHSGSTDMAKELLSAMRAEAQIQRQVVKELS